MAEISEKELEDYLVEMSGGGYMECGDLYIEGSCFRQVNLGGYGIADLLFVEVDIHGREIVVEIVELKKDSINMSAVGQICRYKVGVGRFMDKFIKSNGYLRRFSYRINCSLVGQKYQNDDTCFVVDTTKGLSTYLYGLDLDTGITISESEGWYQSDENTKKLREIFKGLKKEHRADMMLCIKAERPSLR